MMWKWYNKRTVTIGVVDARFLMTRQGDGPQIGRWRGRWRPVLTCVGGSDHAGRPTAVVVAPQHLKMIFVTEGDHQVDIVLEASTQFRYRYLLKKTCLDGDFHNIAKIIQLNSFIANLKGCENPVIKKKKYGKGIILFIYIFFAQQREFIYKVISCVKTQCVAFTLREIFWYLKGKRNPILLHI